MKRHVLGLALAFMTTASPISAQNTTEETVVYESPSPMFVTIELQAHNGLPRFGALNNYSGQGSASKPQLRPVRGVRNPQALEKAKSAQLGLLRFSLMVGLKYMTPFMDDLDRTSLTTMSSNTSQEQQNSAYLQRFLRNQVAPNIGLDEACTNAGQGKNEFERLRNYKTFVDNCLGPLERWSQDFFKNDELTGYHVSTLHIGNGYDFDKKGYWVQHHFSLNNIFPLKQGGMKRVDFEPVAAYESELLKKGIGKKSIQFFLKMDGQDAERLVKEGINRLYLVKKIRMVHSGNPMSRPSDPVTFNYAHASKELYIYEDEALTKLFTTLSLDNLVLKTP